LAAKIKAMAVSDWPAEPCTVNVLGRAQDHRVMAPKPRDKQNAGKQQPCLPLRYTGMGMECDDRARRHQCQRVLAGFFIQRFE
jgi:hypothetical protein